MSSHKNGKTDIISGNKNIHINCLINLFKHINMYLVQIRIKRKCIHMFLLTNMDFNEFVANKIYGKYF